MASQQGRPDEWTLLELLNWTTNFLEEKGVDSSRLNAELLLSQATDLDRIMLYARFEETINPDARARFRKLVRRRADHEPLQYILGTAEFYGRDFVVNRSVLIPRPETELVVDKCLEKIPEAGEEWRAADIGTGSGAIAVTLACQREGLELAAVDSEPEALDVARENAARHGVEDRIQFASGRLCEPLPPEWGECGTDLVVSNPPYIPSERIDNLQPEVRDYEPRSALDGGEDGLKVIRPLIPAAADILKPEGWLVLELDEDQAPRVKELIDQESPFDTKTIETVVDSIGCERVIAVRKTS